MKEGSRCGGVQYLARRSPQATTTMQPTIAVMRCGEAAGNVAANTSSQRNASVDMTDKTSSSQSSTRAWQLVAGCVSGFTAVVLAVFIGSVAGGGFDDVFSLLYTSHPFLTAAGMAIMSAKTAMQVIGFLRLRPV